MPYGRGKELSGHYNHCATNLMSYLQEFKKHFSNAKLMDIQFYRGIKNITQTAFLVKFCISQWKTSKGYVPFAG